VSIETDRRLPHPGNRTPRTRSSRRGNWVWRRFAESEKDDRVPLMLTVSLASRKRLSFLRLVTSTGLRTPGRASRAG